MKKIKLQVYAAVIIATVFLLVIWQVLGRWQFSISIEPAELEPLPVEPLPESLPVSTPTATSLPNPTPKSTITESVTGKNSPKASSKPSAPEAGTLRVSNQSEHPVRLALLHRQSTAKSTKQSNYGEPAHWDFDPGEGESRGLILGLPDGNVKLERGDILVAFAQDGSRRYWGPYVVGETPQPILNRQTSEWQLILQP